jgi:hypothetical protein
MILNPSLCLIIALSLSPLLAQNAPRVTLSIDRVAGEADTAIVRNKLYVDIDAIVGLLGATQERQGNRVVIYLPDRSPSDSDTKLSRPLIVAGIELITIIREWRQGIINATVNSLPFMDQWAGAYPRNAESKLAFASAAASTDGDRNAVELLENESRMIHQFSDKYLEKRKELAGVFPDEIENDPLGKQILDCAQGMTMMVTTHQFQDVPACH